MTDPDTETVDPDLLSILACPATHQGLAQAERELLERLNAAIAKGRLRSVGGAEVREPLRGGLVREDRKIVYPIRDGIPVLLVDEGLPVP